MTHRQQKGVFCPPSKNKPPKKGDALRLRINMRHPSITVADLALMLEIDLMLGRKRDFRTRLQKALHAAATTSSRKMD